jgi:hypothetical protein
MSSWLSATDGMFRPPRFACWFKPRLLVHTLRTGCDGWHPPMFTGGLLVRRSVFIFMLAACLSVAVGCGSDSGPSPSATYCATVERTSAALAGTDPSVKRPAMFELRDVAPAEIRGYWDAYVAADTELAERDLARVRIAEYEAANCS